MIFDQSIMLQYLLPEASMLPGLTIEGSGGEEITHFALHWTISQAKQQVKRAGRLRDGQAADQLQNPFPVPPAVCKCVQIINTESIFERIQFVFG